VSTQPGAIKIGAVLQAATNLLVAAVAGFAKLGQLPMDARLVVVGGAFIILWVSYLAWCLPLLEVDTRSALRKRRTLCAIGVATIAASTVLALRLVTEYHTVRLELRQLSPTEGHLVVFGSRFPTTLKLEFTTQQASRDSILTRSPSSWGPAHIPVNFGLPGDGRTQSNTFIVTELVHPQVLGVWFRLAGEFTNLKYVVSEVEPPDARILDVEEQRRLNLIFWGLGGLVCVVGWVAVWFHRSLLWS